MSFISVLFALLLEQVRPLSRDNPVHVAVFAWVRWCARMLDAGKPVHGWLAWALAMGLPALLVLALYGLLYTFVNPALAWLWSAVVLYATLGFRQFSFHFTRIRDALVKGDDALARSLLADWQHLDVSHMSRSEIVGCVIETSVLSAHRHVFGVLAWFSLLAALGLGPVGAVLYRMAELVSRHWRMQSQAYVLPVSAAAQQNANQAWTLIDWLPARITAISFAVVGNFEEAIDNWRRYAQQGRLSNGFVVLAAMAGAVNVALFSQCGYVGWQTQMPALSADEGDWVARPKPQLQHLAVAVGLVWRTVVLWLLLLALLTLARLLG